MMVKIANELHHRGHIVELAVVDASGPTGKLVETGVRTSEIRGSNSLGILYNLIRHLRNNQTDVLLSTMEIPNIIAMIATRYPASVPVVLRSASIYSKRERTGKYRLIPPLKRLLYSSAESIVTISDGVAKDLAEVTGIDESEFTTIYNPAFDPEIQRKAEEPVEHEWFEEGRNEIVIAVGSLKPAKDYATLIRAIHRLQDTKDTYLVILGDGQNKDNLIELSKGLGIRNRVSFPGFVDNPYAYITKANVLVLSSAWEGFGNVLVEAMACGTPVVSTDCPGGPSEILNEGEYGPLVPVGDEKEMARVIEEVLSDPIDPLMLETRARDFAIEPIVDKYEEVLLSVAG